MKDDDFYAEFKNGLDALQVSWKDMEQVEVQICSDEDKIMMMHGGREYRFPVPSTDEGD